MIAKRVIVYLMLCVLLLSAFLGVSQSADAASGSITVAPGETKYLSFGTCAAGEVLLWDLEISTLSTIFVYWLQAPSGAHLSLYSLTWGKLVDTPGEWKLGFSIDESGWWSATVYYVIYRTTPDIEVQSPLDSSYLNEADIAVSGTVDGFADEVALSLDDVHYDQVDLYLGAWNGEVTLPADGDHTIYAEATTYWGSYWVKYYDWITVTLDRVAPEVGIVSPSDGAYLAGDLALEWQCSDECGIALTEVKIDLLDWSSVEGCEHSCTLVDGEHTVQVRVTDLAGNTAIDAITVVSDTVAPTLSITTPADDSYVTGILDLSWICSDDCDIALREVMVDSTQWIETATNEYSCELSEGVHTASVRVTDLAGNTDSASISVTSDTIAPALSLTAPTNNSNLAGLLNLLWQCSDECGIDRTEIRIDGLEWTSVEGTEHTCELSDGTHTIEVRVSDLAGNSASSTVTVLSDTVAPTVALSAPGSDSKLDSDSVTVSWSGSDALSGIDHYEVRISGGDWVDVGTATSYTFTGLEDKWYSITVRAVDKSGNTEESSVSFGIYTSIWSANGPYDGIPLYALIAAIIIAAVASVLLFRRKRGGAAIATAPEEAESQSPQESVLSSE